MKKIILGIPTGNNYFDGNNEYGKTIEITYSDKEIDLIEKIEDLPDDIYNNSNVITINDNDIDIDTPCYLNDLILSIYATI